MIKAKTIITIALFGIYTSCFSQQTPDWNKWTWIIGKWVGEGNGQPGQGEGFFTFKTDLDNNIMIRESHSEFPATDTRLKAIHNDLMIVYPDNQNSPLKAIYFDNEGHTINYLVTITENTIIFISEKRQDVPVFRLTYTFLDKETVNTKFEMSQDGVSFVNYIEGRSKKTK